MRYIDIERLEELEDWPPGRAPISKVISRKSGEGFCAKLRRNSEMLRMAKHVALYSQNISNLWSEVKEHYRVLSHDKCWYCEASTHRIPGDIDHYRPKAGVAGIQHPGYWWLGFNWRNWRFACRYCNSQFTDSDTGIVGGKGNHFPLLDGEKSRISHQCDYEDLCEEEPLLLDLYRAERHSTAYLYT